MLVFCLVYPGRRVALILILERLLSAAVRPGEDQIAASAGPPTMSELVSSLLHGLPATARSMQSTSPVSLARATVALPREVMFV